MSEPLTVTKLEEIKERVKVANAAIGSEAIGMNATIMWGDVPALIAEVERLREALTGAKVIAETAKGFMIEKEQLWVDNENLRSGGHFTAVEMAKVACAVQENVRLREDLKVSREATTQTTMDLIEQRAENASLWVGLKAANKTAHKTADHIRRARAERKYWRGRAEMAEVAFKIAHGLVDDLRAELKAANDAISELAECIQVAEPYNWGKEIIEKYRRKCAENGGTQNE